MANNRCSALLAQLAPSAASSSSSPSFTYSLDPHGLLTRDQRAFYDANGYLLIKQLISPEAIQRYLDHFLAVAEGRHPAAPGCLVMRDVALAKAGHQRRMGEAAITKLQDWCNDELFMEYARHEGVLKYVEAIIGGDIRSIHYMLINKPTDLGMGKQQTNNENTNRASAISISASHSHISITRASS